MLRAGPDGYVHSRGLTSRTASKSESLLRLYNTIEKPTSQEGSEGQR